MCPALYSYGMEIDKFKHLENLINQIFVESSYSAIPSLYIDAFR